MTAAKPSYMYIPKILVVEILGQIHLDFRFMHLELIHIEVKYACTL